MPNVKWKKSDFARMISEGKVAFDSAWKELKICEVVQHVDFEFKK